MDTKRHLRASLQPNGDGHQITYEDGSSRKVHHFRDQLEGDEPPPHGAGSFHDPAQHSVLMDRIEDYQRKNRPKG